MTIHLLKLIVTVSTLVCASSVALAECKVSGPSPMYLGANKTYALSIKVELGGPCLISFSPLSDTAHFSTAQIIASPNQGKLISAGTLAFVYTGPGQSGADNFSLRVCGTDQAGQGCDRLDYSVDVR